MVIPKDSSSKEGDLSIDHAPFGPCPAATHHYASPNMALVEDEDDDIDMFLNLEGTEDQQHSCDSSKKR